MGGRVFGFLTLAVFGVVLADVLIHPKGVHAFGSQANKGLSNTYSALLGKAP